MDIKLITQLRNQTGAGMKDCQEALEESAGDLSKAVETLRKKGAKIAGKRAEKQASEGLVYAYIHSNKKLGALLVLNCETDFVALNEEFKNLAHDLALQIVAGNPIYVSAQDVPEDILNKEKELFKEQLLAEGKPEQMLDKIIEGKINKWYEDVCLLNQHFIKDEDITIQDLLDAKTASLGEKIIISGFSRKQI